MTVSFPNFVQLPLDKILSNTLYFEVILRVPVLRDQLFPGITFKALFRFVEYFRDEIKCLGIEIVEITELI